MTANKQFRNACMFCGSGETSREHIFPQWLGRKIPIYDTETHREIRIVTIAPEQTVDEKRVTTGRPITSFTTKKVCRSCNGGWLSELETKMQIIYDRIQRATYLIRFSKQDIETICAWAMLHTVEWLVHQGMESVPDDEIHHLFKTGLPPGNWSIWIGHSENTSDIRPITRTLGMTSRSNPDFTMNGKAFNAQCTTFRLGHLYLQTISYPTQFKDVFTTANLTGNFKEKFFNTRKIWPSPQSLATPLLSWPEISEDFARYICYTFGGTVTLPRNEQ